MSSVIASRDVLEARRAELEAAHADAVPRPERWGGYRVEPRAWEFWQHRPNRLHDRFRYERSDGAWRAVSVTSRRAGVRIASRGGYFAPQR